MNLLGKKHASYFWEDLTVIFLPNFIYLFPSEIGFTLFDSLLEVIFQFPKQTIIESFKTRKNIPIFTSEKRKLKWPFEVLINDISSSIGFAFRSFVISVLKDKTIICSDNRPRQSSFSDSLLEQNSKNRDQSALFLISRFLYTIYMGKPVGSRIGFINVAFSSQNRVYHSDRRGNRTAFSKVPSLPEVFHCNDPKSRISSFTSQPDFTKFTITRMLCQSEQQMSGGESYSFRVLQNRPKLIAEGGLKLTTLKTAANEKARCRSWRPAYFSRLH